MTTTDLARQDAPSTALVAPDPEAAAGAGRRAFPVTLICKACDQPFVAVVWYRSDNRSYCSDLCRDMARGDQRATIESRFWAKVDKAGPIPEHRPDLGPCWIWTGSTVKGYGSIYGGRKTEAGHNLPLAAHRLSYEICVGPIPDGLTIDHLCRMTRCVNPGHLEPVTMVVNILRSEGMSAKNARASECQRGHSKVDANLYRYPDGRTECAPCRRIRMAAFRSKRSES